MTALSIFDEAGTPVGGALRDRTEISAVLNGLGVQFEQWNADRPLSAIADQAEVLSVFEKDVERLNRQYGFQSVDVIAMRPDHPQKAEFRGKFLAEHTHSDFEIRYFVDGCGLFYLHIEDKVYLVLCEKGDLISVPANTTHWFDMGAEPDFKCIRFFTTDAGWVGDFTGSGIAERFPDLDRYRASLS